MSLNLVTSPPPDSVSTSSRSSRRLLPPELIRQIFEDVSNLGWRHGDHMTGTFKKSRATLHSLCLASRQFRTIAQPLLLSRIVSQGDSQFNLHLLLSRNAPDALRSIRTIQLVNQKIDARITNHLVALAVAATGLQELLCCGGTRCLQPFFGSNLTTMSLSYYELRGNGAFTFPKLKYLNFFQCTVTGGPGGDIHFDLPALRHVALTPMVITGTDDFAFFFDSIASTLASISCPLEYATRLPPSVSAVPRCFDFFSQSVSSFPPPTPLDQHRLFLPSLYPSYGADPVEDALRVEEWTEHIEEDLLCPRILITPTIPIDEEGEYLNLEAACEGLAEVCKGKKIQVVKEKCSGSVDFWNFVSPSFIRKVEATSVVDRVE
ncbi:hypothetical protein JCM3765_004034 [Sporobolomyces pararoseus]